MRDPQRIAEVLKRIQAVWEREPDLRLGQLLVNVAGAVDLFYVEDEELATLAERCVQREQRPII